MAKLYTRATWVSEVLAAAERYTIKEDGGSTFKDDMQIVLKTGVSTPGTALDAAIMNNIEGGLDAVDTRLDALDTWAGYALLAQCASFSPADGTTYYFGTAFGEVPLTTAYNIPVLVPKAGKIKRIDLTRVSFTLLGSAEQSTIALRLNNTTDHNISTTLAMNANGIVSATGLSITVAAGDLFEIKWVTPTWATNPTGVVLAVQIWIERT